MLNLIVKDILVQKKQLLFSFIYILFIIFVFQSIGNAMFSMGIVAFTYMLVINSCAYEDKNNSDIMINCLPIKRARVVTAKYLSIFVYILIGTISYAILTQIIAISGIPIKVYSLTLDWFIGGVAAVALMMGLYFPVFFKIGYMRSKIINFILFFVFFFGVSSLAGFLQRKKDSPWVQNIIDFGNSQGDTVIGLIIVGAVFVFLGLSYLLSVRFYVKREF